MFQTEVVKKTYYSLTISPKNRAIYEIARKNIQEQGRSQMTITNTLRV
jgi:hypothetical protein